jgi:hypothetical protein
MNQLTFDTAVKEAQTTVLQSSILGVTVWISITKARALAVVGNVPFEEDTPPGFYRIASIKNTIAKLSEQGWETNTLEFKHKDQTVWSFDWDDRILRIYCSEG